MREAMMKFRQGNPKAGHRRLKLASLLLVAAVALSGCVVYPSSYGYGYGGYAPGYYAAPVVVGVGGGWGGGWGRGGWR